LYCNRALDNAKLLSLDEHTLAFTSRGLAYLAKKDYRRAVADLQSALRINDRVPERGVTAAASS
jgi:Tfp pilus assembly protein PilF